MPSRASVTPTRTTRHALDGGRYFGPTGDVSTMWVRFNTVLKQEPRLAVMSKGEFR